MCGRGGAGQEHVCAQASERESARTSKRDSARTRERGRNQVSDRERARGDINRNTQIQSKSKNTHSTNRKKNSTKTTHTTHAWKTESVREKNKYVGGYKTCKHSRRGFFGGRCGGLGSRGDNCVDNWGLLGCSRFGRCL